MYLIGVMLNSLGRDRLGAFSVARELGFDWVHTNALPESWLRGRQREEYVEAARNSGVRLASMFIGFDGQSYADLPAIRRTVGLVIPDLREHRRKVALEYCGLAAELQAGSLSVHMGFLPPRRNQEYRTLVTLVRELARACSGQGPTLNLETGQDPASDLEQFIADVNHDALGVNFDPANFILYGSDEPKSAFDILAPHIRGIHCKDAIASHQPGIFGTEVPLGQGEVDFPELLAGMERLDFPGPIIIEREQGANPVADVVAGRRYLEKIMAAM